MMNIAYLVVECRPVKDEGYADLNIGDDSYIFHNFDAILNTGDWERNIRDAILVGIDINRTQPDHKYIVMHPASILKLTKAIMQ